MPDYTTPERARLALLTINAQRDFITPGSPLKACGVTCAVPALHRLVDGMRAQGVPIVHAIRLYRPDGTNVDGFRRMAVEEGLRVLMPGTLGAELIDEVKPDLEVRLDAGRLLSGRLQEIGAKEWLLYKPRWGAFHETGLEAHLRGLGVTTLAVAGFNFSTSGRATVYEAGARDFRIVLVPDALTGSSEDAVRELGRIGVYLMDVDECLGWIQDSKHKTAVA